MISRKLQILLTAILIISSLILLYLIFSDALPWLRGPAPETSEWYWPYKLRILENLWPSILFALLFFLVATWWTLPELSTRKQDFLAIILMVPIIICLQIALIYADRSNFSAELIDRTLSNLSSGFFEPAAEIDNLGFALRQYPQLMETFVSEHARTHPPGLISLNWLSIKFFGQFPELSERIALTIWPQRCKDLWLLDKPPEIAAALGFWAWLPLIISAFTIIPAYSLSRALLSNKQARLASVLVGSIPALILFAPKSVQIYPILILLAFWLFHNGLQKSSYFILLLSGVLVSVLSFLNLGNAAIVIMFVTFAFLRQMKPGTEAQSSISQTLLKIWKPLLIWLFGAISLWLLYWMIFGVPPWAIAQTGLEQHYELVTNIRRYEWWVVWNIIDLILFSGWPLILGFVGGLLLLIKRARRRNLTAVDYLLISILLLILILNISGSSRGEVGRLWLFFMPLLALPSARFWDFSSTRAWNLPLIIALQLTFVLALGLAWQPVRAVIVVAERPVMEDVSIEHPMGISFTEDPISLLGYSLLPENISNGDMFDLTLFWQANGPVSRPYTVFNHLLDSSGQLVAQKDNWPINGQWPPTCWHPEVLITDTHELQIPQDLPTGTYKLITGFYDHTTGARLTIEDGQDFIYLQDIVIEAD